MAHCKSPTKACRSISSTRIARPATPRATTAGGASCTRRATPVALLPDDRRHASSKHELLNLAGRRLGQVLHEPEPLRELEVSEPSSRKLAQLVLGGALTGLQYDEGAWRLAPALVGKADDSDLLDRRM